MASAAHLAANLPFVGGGEHAVPQYDAPIDDHGTHIGRLHSVGKMGHRIVERH